MVAQSIDQLEATKNDGPLVTVTETAIDPVPPLSAAEFPSILDPSVISSVAPVHPGINTRLPTGMFPQTTPSSTLPIYSFQTPFGGISGNPHLGFDYEIPRALPQRDCYLESFYRNFYAAHPFILPKGPLIVLRQETPLEPLLAAMRWIGSLYIERDTSPSLFREAFRLIDGNTVKDGFLVQARLLLAIGLDGNHRLEKARKLMAEARDISIQIGMNSQLFATTNGQRSPIVEESWRRTWWELYVVDALMSGVHQTDIFTLYDVPSDVALPCEELQYLTGVSRPIEALVCAIFIGFRKYLPRINQIIWRTSDCSTAGHCRRMPIEFNVPASWASSKGRQQRLSISTSSSLIGCFVYHLQNTTLMLRAKQMKCCFRQS